MRFPVPPLVPGRRVDDWVLQLVQGNVLKSHGRKEVALMFFRIRADAEPAAVKRFARSHLVSAAGQDRAARNYQAALAKLRATLPAGVEPSPEQLEAQVPQELFCSFALTASGFLRLEPDGRTALEPQAGSGESEPPDQSFWAGMVADAGLLQDPVDDTGMPRDWQAAFRQPLDGMWLLAHANAPALKVAARALAKECAAVGLECFEPECGRTEPREPFGFRDGLSRSGFIRGDWSSGYWTSMPLRQVLLENRGLHTGGSFLVVRKLEQNVASFRTYEDRIKGAFAGNQVRLPANEAGALIVGRERDGRVLVEDPRVFDRMSRGGGFSRDTEGRTCPFHAHIRKVHPRTNPSRHQDLSHEAQKKRQFVRRSVVFDQHGVLREGAAVPPYPDKDVGLLFMAYMASIDAQFVHMMGHWLTDTQFPGPGDMDPFIGRPPGAWQWTAEGKPVVMGDTSKLSPFVVARGGAYLYVPPIPWFDPARAPAEPELLTRIVAGGAGRIRQLLRAMAGR